MGQRLPRVNTQFGKLINADLVTYAQAIIDGLTANAVNFPNLPVNVATLQGYLNAYSTALAASIGGSAEQRALMHSDRALLRNVLRQDAWYVNQVAVDLVNSGQTYDYVTNILLGSGYQIGKTPTPAGELPAPTITKYSSPKIGALYVLVEKVPNASAYIIEYGVSGSDPDTWNTVAFAGSRINLNGLASGVAVDFRVYAKGANPVINFSVVLTQVII